MGSIDGASRIILCDPSSKPEALPRFAVSESLIRRADHPAFPRNLIDGILLLTLATADDGICTLDGSNMFATFSSFTSLTGGLFDDCATAWVMSASVSIAYRGAPTSTVSSTAPKRSKMMPCVSALISTVTLSVSTRATTSSTPTASPTPLDHSTIVPSVMESPIVGTFIVTFSKVGMEEDTHLAIEAFDLVTVCSVLAAVSIIS
mmetsp:Transcript_17536/g.27312  ORF Transcript_17536/g.27312 Transcript_17536/m.27312 type:complete len:205 (+) Transcript_17536:209-823(+)